MRSHQWYLGELPLSQFFQQTKEQEEKIQENKYLQYITASQSKIQKSKSKKKILLLNTFEEDEKGLSIKILAKVATILNVNITNQKWAQSLKYEQISQISSFNHQALLIDINKESHVLCCQKFFRPQISLKPAQQSERGIFLIIENRNHPTQKSKIKVLNHENIVHSLVNNVKCSEGIRTIQIWNNVQSMVFFQKLANRKVSKQFLAFLLSKYEQVIYVAVAQQSNIFLGNFDSQKALIDGKSIHLISNKSFCIFSSKALDNKIIEFILGFYKKYTKIDNIICKQIEKSKVPRNVFNKNKFCMKLYAMYYNFISLNGLESSQDINKIQDNFFQQIVKLKQQKNNVQAISEKTFSHYPDVMQNGQKICPVCFSKQNKKKKTKIICKKCTQTSGRQIGICVAHFQQFHIKIDQYLPGRVSKGAHDNQNKNSSQSLDEQDFDSPQESIQQMAINKDAKHYSKKVSNILKSWEAKADLGREYLSGFLGLMTANNQSIFPARFQKKIQAQDNMHVILNQSGKVQQKSEKIIKAQNKQLEKKKSQKQGKKKIKQKIKDKNNDKQ